MLSVDEVVKIGLLYPSMMICFYLAHIAIMRDFYTYRCYSTFYILTLSYRAYMGFIGYLCTYTPKREWNTNSMRRRTPAEGKEKKHKINSA